MNNRIQELAEQVGFGWDDKYHWYVGNEQMKKFAELIVQDCISQIAMIGVRNCDDPDVVWTIDKAIQIIKQHFEVGP